MSGAEDPIVLRGIPASSPYSDVRLFLGPIFFALFFFFSLADRSLSFLFRTRKDAFAQASNIALLGGRAHGPSPMVRPPQSFRKEESASPPLFGDFDWVVADLRILPLPFALPMPFSTPLSPPLLPLVVRVNQAWWFRCALFFLVPVLGVGP